MSPSCEAGPGTGERRAGAQAEVARRVHELRHLCVRALAFLGCMTTEAAWRHARTLVQVQNMQMHGVVPPDPVCWSSEGHDCQPCTLFNNADARLALRARLALLPPGPTQGVHAGCMSPHHGRAPRCTACVAAGRAGSAPAPRRAPSAPRTPWRSCRARRAWPRRPRPRTRPAPPRAAPACPAPCRG